MNSKDYYFREIERLPEEEYSHRLRLQALRERMTAQNTDYPYFFNRWSNAYYDFKEISKRLGSDWHKRVGFPNGTVKNALEALSRTEEDYRYKSSSRAKRIREGLDYIKGHKTYLDCSYALRRGIKRKGCITQDELQNADEELLQAYYYLLYTVDQIIARLEPEVTKTTKEPHSRSIVVCHTKIA